MLRVRDPCRLSSRSPPTSSSAIRRVFGPYGAPIVAYPPVMEALAERLSQLDSHVQGAIRVVAFYETLMRRRVDLPALARASAGLAECVAGVRMHGTGRVIRVSPDGRPASALPPPASTAAPITLDEEEIGTVWLERSGPRRARLGTGSTRTSLKTAI